MNVTPRRAIRRARRSLPYERSAPMPGLLPDIDPDGLLGFSVV